MSLLQEWAVRVAEEADAHIGQTPSSSQPILAPSVPQTGSGVNAPKSCLGLEGDTFPPSYDDDTVSDSRTTSVMRRRDAIEPTPVQLERDAGSGTRARTPNANEKDTSDASTVGMYMRARPLLWSIEDVARDTVVFSDSAPYMLEDPHHVVRRRSSAASATADVGTPTEKLPPWRRPSITRSAFPSAQGYAPTSAPHATNVESNSFTHPGHAYCDTPPAYAPPSPPMYSIPGAYPPSPVVANASERRPPPSPTRPHYHQHRGANSQYSPPPVYNPVPRLSSPSSGSCPFACPSCSCPLGTAQTTIPLVFPPTSTHAVPNALHITIALQSGCPGPARRSHMSTCTSLLLPLGVALVLLLPLTLMIVTVLSSGMPYGARSSSPSSASVHASLMWRVVSSLLSYVFRTLGEGDGKL